jgi:NDP-sugar pyrophosphorylase family protein
MVKTKDLLDLSKTIAADLFENKEYPWEVLGGIGEFILALGPALPEEEFDHPKEGVWTAKDAKIYSSVCIEGPCIVDRGAELRHCAFIRGNVIIGKKLRCGKLGGSEEFGAFRLRSDPSLQLCGRLGFGL